MTANSRRKTKEERKDVIECCKLGELKTVQWHVQGDEGGDVDFPDWVRVRLVDLEGNEAEIVLHLRWYSEYWEELDQAALNKVFNHFGLLPAGKIIGINWSVSEAVNYARAKFPGKVMECSNDQVVL